MDDEFERDFENINDNEDSDESINKRAIQAMLAFCFFLAIVLVIMIFIGAPGFDKPSYNIEDMSKIDSNESNIVDNDSRIGINSASYEDLLSISGIGPTNAQKILDFINERGTIVSFDDLLDIEGIGDKKLEQIKESCYID